MRNKLIIEKLEELIKEASNISEYNTGLIWEQRAGILVKKLLKQIDFLEFDKFGGDIDSRIQQKIGFLESIIIELKSQNEELIPNVQNINSKSHDQINQELSTTSEKSPKQKEKGESEKNHKTLKDKFEENLIGGIFLIGLIVASGTYALIDKISIKPKEDRIEWLTQQLNLCNDKSNSDKSSTKPQSPVKKEQSTASILTENENKDNKNNIILLDSVWIYKKEIKLFLNGQGQIRLMRTQDLINEADIELQISEDNPIVVNNIKTGSIKLFKYKQDTYILRLLAVESEKIQISIIKKL